MHLTEADLRPMRATVQTLTELIELIYPDPNPDILTIETANYRFRLFGLQDAAMRELARSQRIVRAAGDFEQVGLCEFHAGLIFLYWGRCGSARERFTEARRHWQFGRHTASEGLTYFAEGRAQHHAHQYESALNKYGRAEQWLPRIQFRVWDEARAQFLNLLVEHLEAARQDVRARLWPDQPLTEETPEAAKTESEEAARPEEAPRRAAPVDEAELKTQVGYSQAQAGQAQAGQAQTGQATNQHEDDPERPIPRPFLTFEDEMAQSGSPMPGHWKMNDHYVWYQVRKIDRDFLPTIAHKTWVLVNTRVADRAYVENELIAVFKQEVDEAGIVLRPHRQERPFARIYLGRSRFEGNFTRDILTGAVELSTEGHQRLVRIEQDNIMGVVVGFWHAQAGVAN